MTELKKSNSVSTRRKIITTIILLLLIIFACYIIPKKAESAFFYPDNIDYGLSPKSQNLTYEDIRFNSKDGTELHGWFVPAQGDITPTGGTVIFIHGNAANITNHWYLTYWLPKAGFNVFTFDYRGYGDSENKSPTFKGVYEDTQSAIDYVRSRTDIDTNKILLLGQSLGGSNAIAAIGGARQAGDPKNGICGMLIDSTFISPSEIANEKIPYAGFLVNDDYSAERYVQALSPIPLLFLHGSADTVIPMSHSERLYELANEPKELVIAEDIEHAMALSDSASFTNYYQAKTVYFFNEAIQNCNDN